MNLREARAEELPYLGELCLRSKAVWGYDQAFLDACREELSIKVEDLAATSVVVAEVDGVIAGLYQLEITGNSAVLWKLFIEPDKIQRGLGRALFEAAAREAKKRGAARLHIDSDPDAAPFYRRMGAVRTGSVASGSIPGRLLPSFECQLQ